MAKCKRNKKTCIDGFAPKSLKEAIKKFDPDDLRTAAAKAREICKGVIHAESVQDIYCKSENDRFQQTNFIRMKPKYTNSSKYDGRDKRNFNRDFQKDFYRRDR